MAADWNEIILQRIMWLFTALASEQLNPPFASSRHTTGANALYAITRKLLSTHFLSRIKYRKLSRQKDLGKICDALAPNKALDYDVFMYLPVSAY